VTDGTLGVLAYNVTGGTLGVLAYNVTGGKLGVLAYNVTDGTLSVLAYNVTGGKLGVLAYNVTDGTFSVPFVIQEKAHSCRQRHARSVVCFCSFCGLVMHKELLQLVSKIVVYSYIYL
jgi:hypothetical protein